MYENTSRKERWLNSTVHQHTGSLADISRHIPRFDRSHFAGNKYLDVIAREAMDGEKDAVPVGVVSRQYQLIQHRDVLDHVLKATQKANMDVRKIQTTLSMTEYGERMALSIEFPENLRIDPGDGNDIALQLWCFNSVDGSSRLRMLLGWFRLVCSNGMVLGTVDTEYQKRHRVAEMKPDDVHSLITRAVSMAQYDGDIFKRWINTPVKPEAIAAWVDGPVAKKWGIKAAARAWHIASEGRDAEVIPFTPKTQASKKAVNQGEEVPGSSEPATNIFAVSQVLSWLASQRSDVEERLRWQSDIRDLMQPLEVMVY